MTFTVKWSTPARNQFINILMFIRNKWGDKTAHEYILMVDAILEIISNMPEAFPVLKERKNVRRCVINKRTILFYQINGKIINLINLYDTRMNPDKFIV